MCALTLPFRLGFMVCLTVCFLLPAPAAFGDITLPKIFSDHMVLQRNSQITVWGTANPNQKLEIKFLDQTLQTTADGEGKWSTQIKTGSAGGPYQIEVVAEDNGTKVVLSDVMVGEVWLCSGQSNMEWPTSGIGNAEAEIAAAKDFPNLRLFTVANDISPVPLDEFTSVEPWRICSSDTVAGFSGLAYLYGRQLSQELGGIPIGLIDSTWGGTPVEAWTSRTALESKPSLSPLLKSWDERANHSPHRPAHLYNSMIFPIAQYQVRGAIWYQGESNNGRGVQYQTLFPLLIQDWRETFGNAEMPFYFVQLAPFRYGNRAPSALAEVWEAQLKTLQSVPNTGMAVTTDIGNFTDIHPRNKQDVAKRLSLIALSQLYESDLPADKKVTVFSGPIYKSQQIDGQKIRLEFDHVGQGLKATPSTAEVSDAPSSELKEFLVAGEDGRWVPAQAKIDGPNTILVWSDDVEKPVAVRFAWNDTPVPNLFNSAGLPASPFRTDNLPLESANVDF